MFNDKSIGMQLTNEQLINKIVSSLASDNTADTVLLNILSSHIVKVNPKSTAVKDAVMKIEALAEKRAEES